MIEKEAESGKGAAVAMNTHVACLPVFDGTLSKVFDFVTACRLYIRIKMREAVVKEQI